MNRSLRHAMTAVATAALTAAALALPLTASAATADAGASPAATAASLTPVPASSIRTAPTSSIFAGGLYVQSDTQAAEAAASLQAQGQPAEASAAAYIASKPTAVWLGDWLTGDSLVAYIDTNLAAAKAQGATPVFVTYAIPNRDCAAGYSAGGLSADQYLSWNQTIASTLQGHRAVVLVEPDSLSTLDGCPADVATTRLPLLHSAVAALTGAGVPTYLDGGLSDAVKAPVMASRLQAAGISMARGFYTNVANYRGVLPERAYAQSLSALVGSAHYVIDVSRNGRGYLGTWCNAPGAGLGQSPHVTYGSTGLDALLWVKSPGESDGTCNGGPAAGQWFASYAQQLVANRAG